MKKIAKPAKQTAKQPTKKRNGKTVKITKLKIAIDKIAEQLIKDNPKLVKKGSSGYTDLLFNKKSMKGGKPLVISESTKDKIITFLELNAKYVNELKKILIIELIRIRTLPIDAASYKHETIQILIDNTITDFNKGLYEYDYKPLISTKDITYGNHKTFHTILEFLINIKNYYNLISDDSVKLNLLNSKINTIKLQPLHQDLIDAINFSYDDDNFKPDNIKRELKIYEDSDGTDNAGTPPPDPPPAPQAKKEIKLDISLKLNIHIAAAIAALRVIENKDGAPAADVAAAADEETAKAVEDKAKAAAKVAANAAVSEFVENEQGKMRIEAEDVEAYANLFTEEKKIAEEGSVKAVYAGYAGLAAARADDATEKATDALAKVAIGDAAAAATITAVTSAEAAVKDAAKAAAEAAAEEAEAVSEAAEDKAAAAKDAATAALATQKQIDAAKDAVLAAKNFNNDYEKNITPLLITAVVAAAAAALEKGDEDEQVKKLIEKATQDAITKLPLQGGRNRPKYKSTGQVVFILYKKRKYKRTIYVKDKRKTKYCKINNEYILLSKMKIIE